MTSDSTVRVDSRIMEWVALPLCFALSPVHDPKDDPPADAPAQKERRLRMSVRYNSASNSAVGNGRARDSPEAISDEREQAMPCVFVVGNRRSVKISKETRS